MGIRCFAVGAAALVVTASVATANPVALDEVFMKFQGTGAGRQVGLQFWVGSTKVMDANIHAGALMHRFRDSAGGIDLNNPTASMLDGRTIGTFCTDLLESVDDRWRRHTVRSVNDAPATQGLTGQMGDDRSGRLAQLYNFGMSSGLLDAFGGWANSQSGDTNSDQAAAWQLLVWEIVFGDADDANWDSQGAVRVSGLRAGVRQFFTQFKNAANNFEARLDGFRAASRAGSQDQLLVVIPLPPAAFAGMGVLGLVMGAGYIRRRRAARAV